MEMEMEKEAPFQAVITPNIVTLIMAVIIVITINIQYRVGGWSGYALFWASFLAIFWGIVVPVAVLILGYIGKAIYKDNEYITLSFGIIFTIISSVLSAISTYWVIREVIELVDDIGYYGVIIIVCYVVLIVGIATVLSMQIKSLIGGIDLIKYHQAYE
ncbi:MAG: hypothetical protein ACFFD2_10085 [Promethearchaeota archaeon]